MSIIANFLPLDPTAIWQLRSPRTDVAAYLYEGGHAERATDIDKAWQAIHIALTGRDGMQDPPADGSDPAADPLELLVMGGSEIGNDVGYGPARLQMPELVQRIARALEPIDADEFARRFRSRDWPAFDAYAFHPDDLDGELEYAAAYFQTVRSLYLEASRQGQGMLVYFN